VLEINGLSVCVDGGVDTFSTGCHLVLKASFSTRLTHHPILMCLMTFSIGWYCYPILKCTFQYQVKWPPGFTWAALGTIS
jgi:hypothetical protein